MRPILLALGCLLLATLALTQARSNGAQGPELRFHLSVPDASEAVAFTPMADSSYKQLLVVREGAGGQADAAFSGDHPVRGFRLAQGTQGVEGPWKLEGEGPRRVVSLRFEAGVAKLPPNAVFEAEAAVRVGGEWHACAERSWVGWYSLLPPLVAIVLAILLREILLALLLGIVAGVYLIERDPLLCLQRTLDRHLIEQARENFKIIAFTAILGGVVAMIARMGGVRAIVESVARKGKSGRGVQLSTWVMGLVVFFDDYANALLVGNTMRPISDRFRISREKLAYLVDCTAAPIACLAPVSTWIATEVGHIQGWMQSEGGIAGFKAQGAYQVFLSSLPFNFYPILALLFSFLVVWTRRDFGPMLRAERRALHDGQVLHPKARPMISEEMEAAEPIKPHRCRWWNGALPIIVLVGTVLVGLYWSGGLALTDAVADAKQAVAEATDPDVLASAQDHLQVASRALESFEKGEFVGEFAGLRLMIGSADSQNALLWASGAGLLTAALLALIQGLMGLRTIVETTVSGMKAMMTAVLVLVLAWTLSDLCKNHLNTAGYLIEQVDLSFNYLPAVVFLLAALVGFATGSSWGTMGILIPLAMSYVAFLGATAGPEEMKAVLLGSIGAVLAGAVFGDHCSPISDTTVMSSMACGSDHVDHVKTQMPYALVVGTIALFTGYLPAGFGVSPLLCLAVGAAATYGALRLLGRPAASESPSPAAD